MNKAESGMTGGSINKAVVEDIQDYDNAAILEILAEAGVAKPGDAVSHEDIEATKSRATVLARESKVPVAAEALLLTAFIDRMKLVEQLGDEEIKNMSDKALRSVVYADTGYTPTDEELSMLRSSPLGLKEWEKERSVAKEKIGGEFDVAADEEDAVVARGTSPRQAMRRAQDESGRQIGI